MHKLMARTTILEHELSELRLLVERLTGNAIDCTNGALATHVAGYLEQDQAESIAQLLAQLRSAEQEPTLLPVFLTGLLDTKTGFFRHPGAMNAFSRQVLPQLHARKAAEGGQVRIWSAGCGTGEEAYSIAMAVCNAAPNNSSTATVTGKEKESKNNGPHSVKDFKDWAIQIIGSDLFPSSIQIAEKGLYPESAVAGLPPASIRSCFSKIGTVNSVRELQLVGPKKQVETYGSDSPTANWRSNSLNEFENDGETNAAAPLAHLLVKARLRSMVTFNTMNLVKPVYIGRFDCIFCMDVLPSLSRAQRTALIERLHLYLEPGGYLFLSQTEKLSAPNLNFRSETFDGYTFHRKPLAASAAYGR